MAERPLEESGFSRYTAPEANSAKLVCFPGSCGLFNRPLYANEHVNQQFIVSRTERLTLPASSVRDCFGSRAQWSTCPSCRAPVRQGHAARRRAPPRLNSCLGSTSRRQHSQTSRARSGKIPWAAWPPAPGLGASRAKESSRGSQPGAVRSGGTGAPRLAKSAEKSR
jgi:hypothetical protein